MTSKLQVTIPKALAQRYGILPGAEIVFQAAGDIIRVLPPGAQPPVPDRAERLRCFDEATARIEQLDRPPADNRGWSREELYRRGRAD